MKTAVSRRGFLISMGAACSANLLGCSSPVRPLAVAAGIWQGYEPLFYAQRHGWLDQIRLIELPSNASSLRALYAGIVDASALTLDEVLRARHDQLPLKVVLVLDISAGADMLLARPHFLNLRQLKGARIGIDQGTNGTILLAKALERAGLSPQDITIVQLTIIDHLDAWRRQQVDALVTYEPAAHAVLEQGAKCLFDSRQIPDTIVDVLAVRSDFLNPTYAPAIRQIVAAHFRAVDALRKTPQQVAADMADHLKLEPGQVLDAFAGLKLPDAADNQRMLAVHTPTLLESARTLNEFMVRTGLLKRPAPLTDLLVDAYIPATV